MPTSDQLLKELLTEHFYIRKDGGFSWSYYEDTSLVDVNSHTLNANLKEFLKNEEIKLELES